MRNQCNCYLGKNEYFWPQQLIAYVKKIEGLQTKRNSNLIWWGWSISRGWKKLISIVACLQIWRSKWEIWHIKQWQRKWHQLHLYVPTSLDNKDITIVNQNKKWSFNWVYNLIMRSIFLLFILTKPFNYKSLWWQWRILWKHGISSCSLLAHSFATFYPAFAYEAI